MKRTIITILSTALVVGGSAAIVNAAGGPERDVAASSAATEAKQSPNQRATAHAAIRCRNLRCINRQLTALNRDAFQCERIVPVTQYAGYVYDTGGGNLIGTTALDFTEAGDAPSNQFVIYTC